MAAITRANAKCGDDIKTNTAISAIFPRKVAGIVPPRELAANQLVDSITGEAVENHDKARGYEVGENQFLLVEDRELEQARSERPLPGAVPLAEPRRTPATDFAEAEDNQETEEKQHDARSTQYCAHGSRTSFGSPTTALFE